eukprot:274144-Pyramimonas_sp.AAC.1
MNAMSDGIATLLRARMNQRVERCEAAGIQLKILILDGACLHRKLRRTPRDAHNFVDRHESYTLDRDGTIVTVQGGEIMADDMTKAAQLAAWCFCKPLLAAQPPRGGSTKTNSEQTGLRRQKLPVRSVYRIGPTGVLLRI